MVTLALALSASCSAFVAPGTAVRSQSRVAASPAMAMGSDQMSSRRAMLASLVLAVPAAANAMVPGLNGPGLVPAKKVAKSSSTGFGRDFETIRDRSNFWSSQGVGRSLCSSATAATAARHPSPFAAHDYALFWAPQPQAEAGLPSHPTHRPKRAPFHEPGPSW